MSKIRPLLAALTLAATVAAPVRATDPVPLDGALAANDPTPVAGERIFVYLNVTVKVDARLLKVKVTLPDGMQADGAPTESQFQELGAGRTVVFAVPVKVQTAEPRRVLATVTMITDTPTPKLEGAFALELNHRP